MFIVHVSGEEQYAPDSSSATSEDTKLVAGESKPCIGKQHRPYHLLFHNDSTVNLLKIRLSKFAKINNYCLKTACCLHYSSYEIYKRCVLILSESSDFDTSTSTWQ